MASIAQHASRPSPIARTHAPVSLLRPVSSFHSSAIASGVVKVPQMAESISEGTLKQWTKKKGDYVKADEEIATIETDKIDVSVNAPEAGTITETFANEEDTVTVGQDLCKIEPGEAPAEGSDSSSKKDDSKNDESEGSGEKQDQKNSEPTGSGKDKGEDQSKLAKPESSEGKKPGEDKSSPSQQKKDTGSKAQAQESKPTTPAGGSGSTGGKSASSSSSGGSGSGSASKSSGPTKSPANQGQANATGVAQQGSRTERRVKMSRMRLRIAERLKQSQNTAASLTTFNEVDMSALMAFRSRHKDRVLKEHGVKLGFMSAFAKASAQALKEVPAANASIEGEGLGDTIVYRDFVDLSVAVSTDKGLVTPVVRNVETMSLIDIERAIADLGKKARDNKLTLEDMAGGTFTISNGGVFGSLFGTPILNLPGSAILGMHAIKDKPWVVDGKVEVRPIMVIALTYDHRLLDGRDAVTFLVRLKQYLEDMPSLLL
ncbi:hypothetical protein A4X06_0g5327 [Tilletia controversa]|uniref:dihydrolipoyllysine-residue succinyltransferase n=4 Tax=Tilletia TaxID=13289 RepID=A0A8X7SVT1_9BASI|nr:hypothetical protein A4X06_0g5327 [Tilletia controversa]KAE8259198.1 hypothetical protein A4X03_0g4161 [Tilletia caries]